MSGGRHTLLVTAYTGGGGGGGGGEKCDEEVKLIENKQ